MKYYTDIEMTTEAKLGDLVAVAVPEIGEPLILAEPALSMSMFATRADYEAALLLGKE